MGLRMYHVGGDCLAHRQRERERERERERVIKVIQKRKIKENLNI